MEQNAKMYNFIKENYVKSIHSDDIRHSTNEAMVLLYILGLITIYYPMIPKNILLVVLLISFGSVFQKMSKTHRQRKGSEKKQERKQKCDENIIN